MKKTTKIVITSTSVVLVGVAAVIGAGMIHKKLNPTPQESTAAPTTEPTGTGNGGYILVEPTTTPWEVETVKPTETTTEAPTTEAPTTEQITTVKPTTTEKVTEPPTTTERVTEPPTTPVEPETVPTPEPETTPTPEPETTTVKPTTTEKETTTKNGNNSAYVKTDSSTGETVIVLNGTDYKKPEIMSDSNWASVVSKVKAGMTDATIAKLEKQITSSYTRETIGYIDPDNVIDGSTHAYFDYEVPTNVVVQ